MNPGFRHSLLLVTAGLSAPAAARGILYVDDGALPGGDGQSWNTAYRFLQDAQAVAFASAGAVSEIHVAGGVYLPDRDEATPGGMTTSCCIANGGTGCDESGCELIVCGTLPPCCDVEWDDVCVMLALELCGPLCIDSRSATFQLINGVALRGGYAGPGTPNPDDRDIDSYETVLSGDLLGDDGPPGSFTNTGDNVYNVVTASGTDSSAELEGFTISGGYADGPDDGDVNWTRGGGIWILTGSPTIRACRVAYNYASGAGGGIYNRVGSSPTITNCTIEGNVAATGSGGGMINNQASAPVVTGCTFTFNQAGCIGGGMATTSNSDPIVTNCTFTENMAFGDGSNPGCGFLGIGGGMGFGGAVGGTVTDCVFTGNSAREGGGMTFVNSQVQNASTTIVNCTFMDNLAAVGGALEIFGTNCSPTLANCLIKGNMAAIDGDGFGGRGGAMVIGNGAQPSLVGCTIIENTAEQVGGSSYTGAPTTVVWVRNSIIYGNSGTQIVDVNGATTNVEYSDIESGYPGTGNIDADPLFVDGFHLGAGSPCIDAGNNMAVPTGITKDLDGNPRFANDLVTPDTGKGECPVVDMGAYEFPTSCPSDVDCDGNVGITDFLALLAAWGTDPGGPPDIDGDGTVGINDFLLLLANWGPCL